MVLKSPPEAFFIVWPWLVVFIEKKCDFIESLVGSWFKQSVLNLTNSRASSVTREDSKEFS